MKVHKVEAFQPAARLGLLQTVLAPQVSSRRGRVTIAAQLE